MPLSRAEATAQIAMLVPAWSPEVVESFLRCTDEDRAAILCCLRDSQVSPPANVWTKVLEVVKDCAEIASLVIPIEGAISGVFGITAAAKAL